MYVPTSLNELFKNKIFRIPDYQRGYAWQREQLKDFWEDLLNLAENRSHYTGVLTIKEIPKQDVKIDDKEYWLADDHSYQVFHVVDGQQRLTTFVILLQALVDFVKSLPANESKPYSSIYLTESLSLQELQNNFLFKVKPTGDHFRTYKFGYTVDNPSHEYMRYKILGEEGGGDIKETFYTLNLSNAKTYFREQIRDLHDREGIEAIRKVYRTLTKRFLFNEYIIKDEFDVFVAFETMNNRGKKLSDLELLKNRLIYLTTLFSDSKLDAASRKSLRDDINGAWKEVYYQLGRDKIRPLNDDEFLRAHWIMFFRYSRKTGRAYIRFLLDEQFSPRRVHKLIEREVQLENPEEQSSDLDLEDTAVDNSDEPEETENARLDVLRPMDIREFVSSLNESAVHWYHSFSPNSDEVDSEAERARIDRLNRIGIGYFRPLVMSILKNESDASKRIRIFERIERFIFIAFRMNQAMATFGNSEFYSVARALDRKEIDLGEIEIKLERRLSYTYNKDGTLRVNDFQNLVEKKFKNGSGYYGWSGLRYFLFEYEQSLVSESRQPKVQWRDLLKTEKDEITIEHIYPQTETSEWASGFADIDPGQKPNYVSTIGNLLLLSKSINSSLQNDSFESKKVVKDDARGVKIRNGYSDGSHSEIEVAKNAVWGPEEIRTRGIKLLKFMEKRWDFSFSNDEERENLLFLDYGSEKK